MNKNLKLALIFVGVVAALVVVFNIESIHDWFEPDLDPSLFEKRLNEVKSKIEAMNGYDEKAYKDLVSDIDVWKNRKDINEEGRQSLRMTLYEGMIAKIKASYNNALANYNDNPTAAHNSMANNVKGLDAVAKDMNKTLDSDANEIKELHKLYTAIYNFVRGGHKPSVDFKEESKTWTSFDDHVSTRVSSANSYRGNSLYSKLSHIKGFNEGLSENQVKSKMEPFRDSYYEDLVTIIIEFFGKSGENQYQAYKNVVNNYGEETDYKSTKAYRMLMSDYNRYRERYSPVQ